NNVLDGGLGNDTMFGEMGNDTYIVNSDGDMVFEFVGDNGDSDTIKSSVSINVNKFNTRGIEVVILTGTGSISATGNGLDNFLNGNDGDNLIDGGAGNEMMAGGGGIDTYIVDSMDDVVFDMSSNAQDADLVLASVSYSLNQFFSSGVERLTLAGSALTGIGNGLNNVITGNSAANTIDGGMGADTLIGGDGGDTYIVDNEQDIVVEQAGAGYDEVLASVSYHAGDYVEILTLTGSANINAYAGANAASIELSGNSGDNLLVGSGGADYLEGGAGADTLSGGLGNDIYYAFDAQDTYIEQVGGGNDTIWAFADGVTMGDHVEVLRMSVGSENFSAT